LTFASFGFNYGTLPTPTRTKYSFTGWWTSAQTGKKITSSDKVAITKATTVFAHWAKSKQLVKFNANKGKVKTKKKTVIYNNKYGKLPAPTRKGYKFKGWYTKKSGGSKITKSLKVKIEKTTTLYAHWTQAVSFNKYKGKWAKVTSADGYGGTFLNIKSISGNKMKISLSVISSDMGHYFAEYVGTATIKEKKATFKFYGSGSHGDGWGNTGYGTITISGKKLKIKTDITRFEESADWGLWTKYTDTLSRQ
jgi:uncharacterized repeat protein (TIGR02543 family)